MSDVVAGVRMREYPKLTASLIHAKDGFVVDTGVGSSGHTDEVYFLPYEELGAALASLPQALSNKTLSEPTLTKPAIAGAMTCDDDALVENLNADKVDGCEPGGGSGDLVTFGSGGAIGKLDVAFAGKAMAEFLNLQDGFPVTTFPGGVINLLPSHAGVIVCELTEAGTINMPIIGAGRYGLPFRIIHRSGAYDLAVNANTGQSFAHLNSSMGVDEKTSVTMDSVGASMRVEYDGMKYWEVMSGRSIVGIV